MPERTCICCRSKGEKEKFYRISQVNNKYVFDKKMIIQNRGIYICKNEKCIEKLSKHRKYNIDIQELIKIVEELKKEKKYIIDILKPMKNSDFFIFGVEENIAAIKREKVKLIILPKDVNNKYIDEFIKLKEKFKITIIFIENKKELIELFSRDVNVIGIFDKKVVNGILNKVEVTNEDIRISKRNGL